MRRRFFIQRFCYGAAVSLPVISSSGCGILLHPERNGAPHNHQIDWKVAALDGLGLILFFVPGVIAFVVDFYTGAIYLPPGHHHANAESLTSNELVCLQIPRDRPPLDSIEGVVSVHTGEELQFSEESSRVSELPELAAYGKQVQRHQADASFGHSMRKFFMPWGAAVGLDAA